MPDDDFVPEVVFNKNPDAHVIDLEEEEEVVIDREFVMDLVDEEVIFDGADVEIIDP